MHTHSAIPCEQECHAWAGKIKRNLCKNSYLLNLCFFLSVTEKTLSEAVDFLRINFQAPVTTKSMNSGRCALNIGKYHCFFNSFSKDN